MGGLARARHGQSPSGGRTVDALHGILAVMVEGHEHIARRAAPSGRIKGAAVREMLLWLEEHLEPERVGRLALMLTERDESANPDLPALGILSSRWYPAPLLHDFCDELIEGLTRDQARRLAYDGGVQALERSFTRFHRMLLRRIASPKLHRTMAQRLWRSHFDTGEVVVDLPAPRRSIVRYSQWTSHHRFICDMCTASDRIIYGAMGLKNVRVRQLSCVDQGADECAHMVTWDR